MPIHYDFFVRDPISCLLTHLAQLTVVSSQCLECESASSLFQPGEGPSRGLFRDCENFADGSFAALIQM